MDHGHVIPNPDGSRARCGGPGICPECSAEAARRKARKAHPVEVTMLDMVERVLALEGELFRVKEKNKELEQRLSREENRNPQIGCD